MQINEHQKLLSSLGRLGFTDMEATIYLDLLKHPGSTGYRIGKSIAKPHANVYQGLVALESKGAVMFEEGESRTFTAIPPAELLEQLRRRFEEDCKAASAGLGKLETVEPQDDRFHRLSNRHQVYSRAHAMLSGATETILFYAWPEQADELRESLSDAMGRGASLAGLVFREEDIIDGSKLIVSRVAERVKRTYRGQLFYLVIDARELLIAFIPEGDEVQAVWARSELVVPVFHNGLVADSILHGLPIVEEIQSPNLHLLGRLPSALRHLMESSSR